MSQIINLRQMRRKKEKAEREAQAEQNRALFGRTKSERQRDEAIKAKAENLLDQHRLTKERPE